MRADLVVLGGDGIGPDVVAAASRILTIAAEAHGHQVSMQELPIGGRSIDVHGVPLTDEVAERCKRSDGVLLGAVGGPRWEKGGPRPEEGLLALRKELEVFANLRPVKSYPQLASASPLRPEVLSGTDILFVRELTGGAYFGRPKGISGQAPARVAIDTTRYSESEIRRVVLRAFALARSRGGTLHSVDKANVLATSRLWRTLVDELAAPDVSVEHVLVDTFAMRLLREPTAFRTVVTENLFGDILTDQAAGLVGSIGLLPSASLAEKGPGLFEPVHGSAPDLAGMGRANPVAAILSAAMLARFSLEWEAVAASVESAVETALRQRVWTADLGGQATTADFEAVVIRSLEQTQPNQTPLVGRYTA